MAESNAGGVTKQRYTASVTLYFGDDTTGVPAGVPFECYPQDVAEYISRGIVQAATKSAGRSGQTESE